MGEYDEEIAGESGVGWIGNWNAGGSEEVVWREVRRRQRQKRSQPPSKGKPAHLGRFIPSSIIPDYITKCPL